MKRFFYDIFVQISLLLMNISFIIKSHYLCALVIWLNLRKYRDIRYKEKIRKKIIIFTKSGVNQYLRETFRKKNRNLNFVCLIFLQKIFFFLLNTHKQNM